MKIKRFPKEPYLENPNSNLPVFERLGQSSTPFLEPRVATEHVHALHPLPLIAGPGALSSLTKAAINLNIHNPLIVLDRSFNEPGSRLNIEKLVPRKGCYEIAEVGQALSASEIQELCHEHRNTDGIIAAGDRHTIDAAKIISAVKNQPDRIDELLHSIRLKPGLADMKRLIVVASLSCGSESNSYALLRDPVYHRLLCYSHACLAADVVILDPLVCASLDADAIANWGLYCLFTCIELSFDQNADVICQAMARCVIQELKDHLYALWCDPEHADLMLRMQKISWMSGIAVQKRQTPAQVLATSALRTGRYHYGFAGMLFLRALDSLSDRLWPYQTNMYNHSWIGELCESIACPCSLREMDVEPALLKSMVKNINRGNVYLSGLDQLGAKGLKAVFESAYQDRNWV